MSARFPNTQYNGHGHAIDLASLPKDYRRMLSVQMREFIHSIEDAQKDNDLEHNPRVIGFLERCYTDAA